ncbi:G2/mitotic-specific cyclin-A [Condylostylus longicornis]|uniref:G2/mitotic-specific cyclin-A n=1 Tax=Condylostylus longicornis TaxID=2530218 RepID=UPI00244E0292|nr:G2/mitotic-specific cyclin-A [Condylostylus longicornis]
MATFKIHHDEKENIDHPIAAGSKSSNAITNKDKRSTLAVLSNLSNQARALQGGKTAFADVKLSGTYQQNVFKQQKQTSIVIGGAENYGTGAICVQTKRTTVENTVNHQASSTAISIEQSKIFTVYEDDSSENTEISDKTNVKNKKTLDESANNLEGAIRDPLKDITKHESGSDTPMSVTDILSSPMSVDKSSISQIDIIGDDSIAAVIDDSIAPVAQDLVSEEKRKLLKKPRNDRERFYEVEEYQDDILSYFRDAEKRSRPKPGYMKRQADINYTMRTILVDWLVEVSEEYKLNTETLFLAISYIDRFLSCMCVVRAKLQLLGTAAMFIAAKYEEIYPPDVGEFVFITDDTYTKTQVLRMEQILLRILDFDLSGPTSYVYINTYAVLYSMSDKVRLFATYLAELALLEGDPYLKYLPSQISSASVALARFTLDLPMWDNELKKISSYDLFQLKEIIVHLCRSHNSSKTLQQQAIQEKYKQAKYLEVAKIEPVDINAENIEEILLEQLELIQQENSFEEESDTDVICSTNSNNESVRKMISSLIF